MESINPNSMPGDNARACSTDALMPPHIGGNDGCGYNYGGMQCHTSVL